MKFKKLYLLFVILGIAAALSITCQRAKLENQYKDYELTISMEDIKKQASWANRTVEEELKAWKDAGINSITLNEETLTSLKSNKDFKISLKGQGSDLFVEATKQGIDFIEQGMKEIYLDNRKIERISDTELLIEGRESDVYFTRKNGFVNQVEKMGLGYVKNDIDLIKNAGLEIRFRPIYISSEQDAKKSIDRFISNVKKYSNQHYVVFQGDETYAADADPEYLVDQLKKNEIAVGMIESVEQRKHFEQLGLEQLVEKMDYRAIRVFSTWDFIQQRYDYKIKGHHHGEEIINAYFRAITERNVRVIFVKPFLKNKIIPVTDMEIYKARISELRERLEKAPHKIMNVRKGQSQIGIMSLFDVNPLWQMFVAFGALGVFMIIIDNIANIKTRFLNILFFLGLAVTGLIYLLKIKLGFFNSVFGLASIVLYVSLASQFIIILSKRSFENGTDSTKLKLFLRSLGLLVLVILLSLAGAVSELSFYAESKYLLELQIFRGVKISQLIPIMLVFFMGLFYFAKIILNKEDMTNMEITRGILNLNVKVWHALAALVVFLGLAVLLIRSGNSDIEPSSAELLMRNLLENTLPARPRTKAFIIGYPSVIILYYFACQKRYKILYPVLCIFVAVGQANILNTFSHFRTPLYLSFMRVFFEFLAATVLTVVYIVVIELLRKLIKRVQKKGIIGA